MTETEMKFAAPLHPEDPGDWRYQEILNVSGGKDSTAMYLLAIEAEIPFRAVFADVGNELDVTYDYVRNLPDSTGGPEIEWVKADFRDRFPARREAIRTKWPAQGISAKIVARAIKNLIPSGNPFLDMCLLRGGFPSPKRRFCTEYLKVVPIVENVYRPLWEAGITPRSWLGMRAEESLARKHLPIASPTRYRKRDPPALLYRPLIAWKEDEVWEVFKRHDIKPNPLYAMGAARVGCGPCIMSRKREVRMIDARFPEAIDRIREWERIVSGVGKHDPPVATFFAGADIPGISVPISTLAHGIDSKVKWSKTAYGGRQYDLFDESEIFGSCSIVGMCE